MENGRWVDKQCMANSGWKAKNSQWCIADWQWQVGDGWHERVVGTMVDGKGRMAVGLIGYCQCMIKDGRTQH